MLKHVVCCHLEPLSDSSLKSILRCLVAFRQAEKLHYATEQDMLRCSQLCRFCVLYAIRLCLYSSYAYIMGAHLENEMKSSRAYGGFV
nr:MAG TPA: hypothetical protein [Caudoviricetes sp.]